MHIEVYSPRPQARAKDKNITTTYCSPSARSTGVVTCTSPSRIDNTTGARAIACCLSPVQESKRCERDLPKSGTSSADNMRELSIATTCLEANCTLFFEPTFQRLCMCPCVQNIQIDGHVRGTKCRKGEMLLAGHQNLGIQIPNGLHNLRRKTVARSARTPVG